MRYAIAQLTQCRPPPPAAAAGTILTALQTVLAFEIKCPQALQIFLARLPGSVVREDGAAKHSKALLQAAAAYQ